MTRQEYFSVLEDFGLLDEYDKKIQVLDKLEKWLGEGCTIHEAKSRLCDNRLIAENRIKSKLKVNTEQ